MSTTESSLVPAHRLGQLLAEARSRSGGDLDELAQNSGGRFTTGELADLEAGHRLLTDQIVKQVTELYRVDCGVIIPQRAELTIDLNQNVVSAAGRAVRLDSPDRDHILDRYLSLVYVLRNHEPGLTVPLRDEDVAILAASLAERSELIEEQLLAAMAADNQRVVSLIGWIKSRLWVPGAGALVGAVSIGTLVMLPSDSGTTVETDATDQPDRRPNLLSINSLPLFNEATTSTDSVVPAEISSTSISATAISNSTSTSTGSTSTSTTSTSTSTSSSSTSSTSTTAAAPSPAAIGAQAEALLPFDVSTALPEWTIEYKPSRPNFRGLTFPYEERIELYVRPSDTPRSLAGVLAHEIGHAIDVSHFDNDDRERWLEARGVKDAQWWPDAYASDFETGAGDFAEAFAYWALRDANSSRLAGTPSAAQLDTMTDLISGHV